MERIKFNQQCEMIVAPGLVVNGGETMKKYP
jgi:hypothetical protein